MLHLHVWFNDSCCHRCSVQLDSNTGYCGPQWTAVKLYQAASERGFLHGAWPIKHAIALLPWTCLTPIVLYTGNVPDQVQFIYKLLLTNIVLWETRNTEAYTDKYLIIINNKLTSLHLVHLCLCLQKHVYYTIVFLSCILCQNWPENLQQNLFYTVLEQEQFCCSPVIDLRLNMPAHLMHISISPKVLHCFFFKEQKSKYEITWVCENQTPQGFSSWKLYKKTLGSASSSELPPAFHITQIMS